MLRIQTSFQDSPDDGYYFLLYYDERKLNEQLEELGLRDGDTVVLWDPDCDLEVKATLLFDFHHPMAFGRMLCAREKNSN